MGYHQREIARGIVGESSKICEEMEEFIDAIEQKNAVMSLVELSDIIGAIEHYLEREHPSITLEDLTKMARTTRGAFEDGSRS